MKKNGYQRNFKITIFLHKYESYNAFSFIINIYKLKFVNTFIDLLNVQENKDIVIPYILLCKKLKRMCQ